MDPKLIGHRIMEYRLAKKMSRERLADLTGLAPPTIRQYECGYKSPSLESLIRIANALDVGADDLLANRLNVTKPVALQGIAKKLEPLSPEQIVVFDDVVDTLLKYADGYGGEDNDSKSK